MSLFFNGVFQKEINSWQSVLKVYKNWGLFVVLQVILKIYRFQLKLNQVKKYNYLELN